jgi:hypothetical protein
MRTPYDVFVSLTDGNIWIGTARSITEAIQLIENHHGYGSKSYLVYCQETQQQSYFKKENDKVVPAQFLEQPALVAGHRCDCSSMRRN